jgi:cytochrome c oxidase assembly factor CtaG
MSTTAFLSAAWEWKPSVVLGCFGLALSYVWLCRFRLSQRAVSWFAGIAVLLLALVSPFDELADAYLFSFHMAKHILFVLVVPALLLIGLPVDAGRLVRSPRVSRVEQILGNPVVAWTAGIGAMAFWHLPAVFNAAVSHEWLHIVEHLSLLVGGTIYWWPVLSPVGELRLRPVPQAAAYLFTSCLACTSMGVLITFAPRLLYPAYAHPHDVYGILPLIREQWGISAAMDQQIGGLLMWVPCCLVYLTAIMAMFARWYGEEQSAVVEA